MGLGQNQLHIADVSIADDDKCQEHFGNWAHYLWNLNTFRL